MFLWGFTEGSGVGRDSFQFCIKTKFTHAFYYYCDCKHSKRVPLDPSCDALGNSNGGLWRVLWWLGHVLLKNKNTETFLQQTKASSRLMTHLTHCSVPVYRWFFPFCVTWQFQPTENPLFVNWRFVLCLTELKFRSLCLISETKGNNNKSK